MDFIIKFTFVMLSVILTDIAWTYCLIKVNQKKSISAGLWSMIVVLFGAFITINYMNDKTLLIAVVIGSFIGTAGTVEFEKRKNKS